MLDVLDSFDRTTMALTNSHVIQVRSTYKIFSTRLSNECQPPQSSPLSTMTGCPPTYRISPVTICAGFRIGLGPLEYPSQVTRLMILGSMGQYLYHVQGMIRIQIHRQTQPFMFYLEARVHQRNQHNSGTQIFPLSEIDAENVQSHLIRSFLNSLEKAKAMQISHSG